MKNNNNNDDLITLDEYSVEFSRAMLTEIFKAIDTETKTYGNEFGENLSMTMLSSFICNLVYNNLKNSSLAFSDEDTKIKEYMEFKNVVQQSVALGFQSAFSQFMGKEVDYFCQILPMPEPINKEPC